MMGDAASPASAGEALGMLPSAMRYLAAATPPRGGRVPGGVLADLEQATAMGTAARDSFLAAFTAGQGHCEAAYYGPRAWMFNKTRSPGPRRRATPRGSVGGGGPAGRPVPTAGEMSESYARTSAGGPTSCRRTARLPRRDPAGRGRARPGWDLTGWPGDLCPVLPGARYQDEDVAFGDRSCGWRPRSTARGCWAGT